MKGSGLLLLAVLKNKMKDCSFYGRKETKYTCTLCPNAVCNACAEPVAEDQIGYDEKNDRVGKCPRGECEKEDLVLLRRRSSWRKGLHRRE